MPCERTIPQLPPSILHDCPSDFFDRLGTRCQPASCSDMRASPNKNERSGADLHVRDQIIHALYLKLKSERETREALLDAYQAGAGPEVMEAIASDPVPLIDDLGQEETVRTLVDRFITRSDMQPVENSGIGGDA